MHAFALLSLIQAMPAAGAVGAGQAQGAAPAASGEGAASGFAELLAGLLAMAGQAQPLVQNTAAPSGGAESDPPKLVQPGLSTAIASTNPALGEAGAEALLQAAPPARTPAGPTLATGESAAPSSPAAATVSEPTTSAPATSSLLQEAGTATGEQVAQALPAAATAGRKDKPSRNAAVPATDGAPGTPGEAKAALRASPATPSPNASLRALGAASRTRAEDAVSAVAQAGAEAGDPTATSPAQPSTSLEQTALSEAPAPDAPGLAVRARVAAQFGGEPPRLGLPASAAAEAAVPASARVKAVSVDAPSLPMGRPQDAGAAAGAGAALQAQLLTQEPPLQPAPAGTLGAPAPAAHPEALVAAQKGPAPTSTTEEPSAASNARPSVAAQEGSAPQSNGSQTGGGDKGDGHSDLSTVAVAPAAGEADTAADVVFEPLAVETLARTEGLESRHSPAARVTSETVANLAAQMARRLDGRNTRFDISLDPAGLGSVQVSVEINTRGELSAHLNFERGDSAAELKARGAELQRALEQAGFDLSKGGLSFEHGPSGRGHERGAEHGRQGHARAFAQALETADVADLVPTGPVRLSRARSGVDLTV